MRRTAAAAPGTPTAPSSSPRRRSGRSCASPLAAAPPNPSPTSGGTPGPNHRYPQFLPDGKRFVFSSTLGTDDTNGVFLTRSTRRRRFASCRTRALAASLRRRRFSPSGRARCRPITSIPRQVAWRANRRSWRRASAASSNSRVRRVRHRRAGVSARNGATPSTRLGQSAGSADRARSASRKPISLRRPN